MTPARTPPFSRRFAWHAPCNQPLEKSRRALEGGKPVDNTFLVGLSQQMAANRAMEVIANNLANLGTPAFKRESVQFEQYVVPLPASEAEGGGTVDVSFVLDRGVLRDLTAGRMEQTGSLLDMSIDGNGYFAVQTPDGERYTRNGHFRLDEQGQVVTEEGYTVLSDGGPITLQPQDGDLRVGPDGALSTDLQLLGKLRVVTFADERALKKSGGSLYDAAGVPATAATNTRVRQGLIEKSNVEPVIEISKMIEVMRAYQASSDLTKSGEDLLKQAIQKIGAVPQA
jgi:flagellar basal-body rod protein FlgF